jgi:1-phosphofructokinase family hexose kinase
MILTITLNTAIDRTLFIKEFSWGKTIRATRTVLGMGGKATDASWILSEIGETNCAMGFAAGETGKLLRRMLEERGSQTNFIWVNGETRTNIVIISESGQGQSTLVSGELKITADKIAEFRDEYTRQLDQTQCLIIGGSVPAGVSPRIYYDLVKEARSLGIPVVFDANGPGLRIGLEGQPTVIKPNIDEISDLAGWEVTTIQHAYQAAKELQKKSSTIFVITLGSDGALAVAPDRAYLIPPLELNVVSSAGAGDAVVAGLSAALSKGQSLEEGLRLGFAAAGAVCLTPATADCRKTDVEAFLPRIRLVPYQG